MPDLAVRGNFAFCLIIVVILIELGTAYRLGVILKLSNGSKSQRDGTIFIGKVDPSRHHVTILIWQLWKG